MGIKAATTNLAGRGLSRLFCALRLNNPLGLNTDFIPGVKNIIADRISRVPTVSGCPPDFTFPSQEFRELKPCHQFHPSPELVSYLWHALLSTLGPGVPVLKTLGHMSQEKDFISKSLW